MADNSPTLIRSPNGDTHDAVFETSWVQEGEDPFIGSHVTNLENVFAQVSEEYAQAHELTVYRAITEVVVTGCNGSGYLTTETRTTAVIVDASAWAIIEDNRSQMEA